MKRLAQKLGARSMRFWGKIVCMQRDYFVAEGEVDTTFRDSVDPAAESCGAGCNKLTYYASNDSIVLY